MTPLVPSSLGSGTSLRTFARPEAPEWAVTALASRREPVEKAAVAARKGKMAVAGLTVSIEVERQRVAIAIDMYSKKPANPG